MRQRWFVLLIAVGFSITPVFSIRGQLVPNSCFWDFAVVPLLGGALIPKSIPIRDHTYNWSKELAVVPLLGGALIPKPAHTMVFIVGENSALYRYDQYGDGPWSTAQKMDGQFAVYPSPLVAAYPNGNVSVFLFGTNDWPELYRFDRLGAGQWSQVKSMGGQWATGTQLAVTLNTSGGLSVFMIGRDEALYRYEQIGPNRPWSPPQSMGHRWGNGTGVGTKPDGSLSVFVSGLSLYRYGQNGPDGAWSPPQGMSGPIQPLVPIVSTNPCGGLSLFVIGIGGLTSEEVAAHLGVLYRFEQNGPGRPWSPERPMGWADAAVPEIVPVNTGEGLSLFYSTGFESLIRWDQDRQGQWSYHPMGDRPGYFAVAANPSGGLSVFLIGNGARGGDDHLYRFDQNGPSGPWSQPQPMGGHWIDVPAVTLNASRGLSVFVVASGGLFHGGALYRYDQNQQGVWSSPQSMGGEWPSGNVATWQ